MIAFVRVDEDAYSIAEVDPDDPAGFMWWCGEDHKWVSPGSSHWHAFSGCWNKVFPALAEATRFARRKGWIE